MKKQAIVLILWAVVVVSCLALVGCAHVHKFGDWNVTRQPTCTDDGVAVGFCECGESTTKSVPKGHRYYSEVTEPTCIKEGYTSHLCILCLDIVIDSYVDALGHDEVQHTAQAATCTEIGWDAYVTCSRCDYSTYKEIPAEHNFVNKVCTKCGEKYASEGLEISDHGTYCEVEGIGTCTDIDIIIPSTYNGKPVTSIGSYAFMSSKNIESITIPSTVKIIGAHAFSFSKKLKIVTISSSVTSIDTYAFSGCSSLTTVTFEKGSKLTSISRSMFNECTSLKNFTIPESVTSIGMEAFLGCTSLINITIPEGATSIGQSAFNGCTGLTGVVIPRSVRSIGDYAFGGCTGLTYISVDTNNSNYKSIDGNLYSKNGETLIKYATGKEDTAFTIPAGVTRIEFNAFTNCKNLTNITIPDSVTRIDKSAFAGCSKLASVTFEDPSGWYRSTREDATSGTSLNLSDTALNATYLIDKYDTYYWYKKTN